MGNKKFTSDDFKGWLADNNITIPELSRTLGNNSSIYYKYADGTAAIPARFKYTLYGVLVERMNRAKKGLDHE